MLYSVKVSSQMRYIIQIELLLSMQLLSGKCVVVWSSLEWCKSGPCRTEDGSGTTWKLQQEQETENKLFFVLLSPMVYRLYTVANCLIHDPFCVVSFCTETRMLNKLITKVGVLSGLDDSRSRLSLCLSEAQFWL